MQINLIYDTSVDNAPPEFKSALDAVVQYLDQTFTNNIKINIDIFYGGEDSGKLADNYPYFTTATYEQLQSKLNLPADNPFPGHDFNITYAEAKALGLTAQIPSGYPDGKLYFSDTTNWNFGPSSQTQSNQYDFFGVAIHELTEIMGRVTLFNQQASVQELFRYDSPGHLTSLDNISPGDFPYLSNDGGITSLGHLWNDVFTGDLGDLQSPLNDALSAFPSTGPLKISDADIAIMKMLGYTTAPPTTVVTEPSMVTETNFVQHHEIQLLGFLEHLFHWI